MAQFSGTLVVVVEGAENSALLTGQFIGPVQFSAPAIPGVSYTQSPQSRVLMQEVENTCISGFDRYKYR